MQAFVMLGVPTMVAMGRLSVMTCQVVFLVMVCVSGISSKYLLFCPLLPLQLEKNLDMSKHTLEYGMRAREFDTSDFQDQSVTRILKKLSVLERAALPEDELKEVSSKGPEQDRVSFATTLCGDTGFSQLLGNVTGQPPLALEQGDSLVLSTQRRDPCLQDFPPKGCLSQAAVGCGCLGGNGTLLAGPSPSCIDSTLPPFGVTLGLGRDQRKTPGDISMGCDTLQEQKQ